MLTYRVKLEPQDEGGYTVKVPALPGCISEGETIEEALGNIQDAMQGYLAVLAKHKREIPIETPYVQKIPIFSKLKGPTNMVHA